MPYIKTNGKPGRKTIGEGELSFAIHVDLPSECLQGPGQQFDIRTPFGNGEGKKEVALGFQPNAAGRKAKSQFEMVMSSKLTDLHGDEYSIAHIHPLYHSRESITPAFLAEVIGPFLPNVISLLNVYVAPSVVFKHTDFMAIFFNRKLKKESVKGFILVPNTEYDEAFEFECFTRGSATYRLRLSWLEGLLADGSSGVE